MVTLGVGRLFGVNGHRGVGGGDELGSTAAR